jgi:hypothetical protein
MTASRPGSKGRTPALCLSMPQRGALPAHRTRRGSQFAQKLPLRERTSRDRCDRELDPTGRIASAGAGTAIAAAEIDPLARSSSSRRRDRPVGSSPSRSERRDHPVLLTHLRSRRPDRPGEIRPLRSRRRDRPVRSPHHDSTAEIASSRAGPGDPDVEIAPSRVALGFRRSGTSSPIHPHKSACPRTACIVIFRYGHNTNLWHR